MTLAIQDFFTKGKLLQEWNQTLIALIPKVSIPTCINDYRPISCCNVLFKCISKIVSGIKISDNNLLTQELLHNYHRDYGHPRCALKADI